MITTRMTENHVIDDGQIWVLGFEERKKPIAVSTRKIVIAAAIVHERKIGTSDKDP